MPTTIPIVPKPIGAAGPRALNAGFAVPLVCVGLWLACFVVASVPPRLEGAVLEIAGP